MSDATRGPETGGRRAGREAGLSRDYGRGADGISALGEGFLIAWEAIAANKIRSVLTVLGVAVGVSVVVAIGALTVSYTHLTLPTTSRV